MHSHKSMCTYNIRDTYTPRVCQGLRLRLNRRPRLQPDIMLEPDIMLQPDIMLEPDIMLQPDIHPQPSALTTLYGTHASGCGYGCEWLPKAASLPLVMLIFLQRPPHTRTHMSKLMSKHT